MIRGEHGIQCMPCSCRIINEMLPETHTTGKVRFSQIYNSFSNNLILCYKANEALSLLVFVKNIARNIGNN